MLGSKNRLATRDAGELAPFVRRLSRQPAIALGAVEDRDQRVAGEPVERDEVAQAPRAVLL